MTLVSEKDFHLLRIHESEPDLCEDGKKEAKKRN